MPFLNILGYNVFDPNIVVPEFVADVGVKKGEKVDYAIKIDGKVSILMECKSCKSDLSGEHMSQLYRYFSVTEARFAIITNGIVYYLFTDLDEPNKMDAKPFFEFNLLNYSPSQIDELKKFAIMNYNPSSILETASDLKYNSMLVREISSEIESPSEAFMELFIKRVCTERLSGAVKSKFIPLVQKALKDTVRELVNQRLSSALKDSNGSSNSGASGAAVVTQSSEAEAVAVQDDVNVVEKELEISPDEIDGYQVIRAILRETVKVERISLRQGKKYTSILMDDSNRRPICRLYMRGNVKYIGFIDNETKVERRSEIKSVDDIFSYADQLKTVSAGYHVDARSKKDTSAE